MLKESSVALYEMYWPKLQPMIELQCRKPHVVAQLARVLDFNAARWLIKFLPNRPAYELAEFLLHQSGDNVHKSWQRVKNDWKCKLDRYDNMPYDLSHISSAEITSS